MLFYVKIHCGENLLTLEIESGLKEDSLNKTGCEKVNNGQLPELPAIPTQEEQA